jgi:hypothetical protein
MGRKRWELVYMAYPSRHATSTIPRLTCDFTWRNLGVAPRRLPIIFNANISECK